jgi:acyl-CoA thioesterase-1
LLIAALALPLSALAAKNILIFGDSLSAGYGIARDDSWAVLLQHELKKEHSQFSVINASISGETTAGGLRRIGRALRKHKPAVVILELGANDGLRGTAVTDSRKNLDRIIMQIRKANARVLLLGMRLPPNYGPHYVTQFRDMYPQLAHKHRVALLPFMLDGIPPDQFQADNLHPTAAAQPMLMHRILKSLRPLLR